MKNCIYSIRNKINNKSYIGKTINAEVREKEHFQRLKNNRHQNYYLQNAYNKYGEENFEFFVIVDNIEENELSKFEIMFISIYQSNNKLFGYNLTSGGDGVNGYTHSEETIKKMKDNHYTKKGNKSAFYNKNHTDKSKEKISISQQGENNNMFGKTHSEEAKAKISEKITLRNQKWIQEGKLKKKINKETITEILGLLYLGFSQTYLSKLYNIPQPTVSLIKNNKYMKY